MRRDEGFTILELLIAASITLGVTAALFAAVRPAEGMFSVESEAADMQQRLRVATSILVRDLTLAGAGTDAPPDAGSLVQFLPPIVPYRQARIGGDAPGTFRDDAITLMYVPSLRSQTTIASGMPSASGAVRVNVGFGCPLTDAACGLTNARVALLYDSHGSFDRFRVEDVQGTLVELVHTLPDSPRVYAPGSRMVEAIVRSYFLKADSATDTFQLMRDDGDGNPAVPVVDHVVGLTFEYFGNPQPPRLPRPPDLDSQPTMYPPGENCVFVRDGFSNAVPRLPALEPSDSSGLTALAAAALTDGPWCPDGSALNRFDADLLRVRRIAVTVRVESTISSLRGPAGLLFARGGTSDGGRRFLPDLAVRFQVSPRNLRLGP